MATAPLCSDQHNCNSPAQIHFETCTNTFLKPAQTHFETWTNTFGSFDNAQHIAQGNEHWAHYTTEVPPKL